MIDYILNKKSKKIKLRQLQQLCGYLNFLSKAVVPGRTFTRRIYAFGSALSKPDHHLYVKQEMKQDLRAWRVFLTSQEIFSHPFFHFDINAEAVITPFYTDASRADDLGCGGICGSDYFILQWEDDLIKDYQPSIAFLELYALMVGALNWLERYRNQKVAIFCDNMSVMHMVNNLSSSCKHCMALLRLLVLHCMILNVQLTVNLIVRIALEPY